MTGVWAVVHDLFELIGGLAAAIAVGFSVWITSRERTDRKQAERDRDEARVAQREAEQAEVRRAREAQARHVVITMTRAGSVNDDPNRVRVACHNYSSMPIMNVALWVDEHRVRGGYRSVLLPQDKPCEGDFVAAPGRKIFKRGVAVVFLDAAGVVWRRTADGGLAEVVNDESAEAPST